jgi:hypothetical protein
MVTVDPDKDGALVPLAGGLAAPNLNIGKVKVVESHTKGVGIIAPPPDIRYVPFCSPHGGRRDGPIPPLLTQL